jgi:hypothetical protein
MKQSATLLLMALLLAAPLSAGVVYEIETTDHQQSPPKTETIQAAADGGNLKMGIAAGTRGGGEGTLLFHGDRREMVIVDHDDKSFMVIDEAAVQKIAAQLSGVSAQMAEALKNVPEEQRAMVEKMMKDRMPKAAAPAARDTVRKTSERGEKAGYPCVKYEVVRDGRVVREMWVTGWSNIDGGAEVAKSFVAMAEFMEEMLNSMPSFGQSGGLGDAMVAQMKEIDGFPVVTRELAADGSLKSESTVRSAKRQTIAPAEFEPPSGYKRRSMPGG